MGPRKNALPPQEIIMDTAAIVDRTELEHKVKQMYREVATNPRGDFHFETMDHMMELRGLYEHEARRLRAQYVRDLLIRTVIAFDRAIRRAASRVQSLTRRDPAARRNST
jgi:hypothetical protein